MMMKKLPIVLCFLFIALLISCVGNDKKDDKGMQKESLTLAIGGEPDNGFDPTTGWGQYASPFF